MSVRRTNICTQGECSGECYRCRLQMVTVERDQWQRIAKDLFHRHVLRGTFGPWSNDWNEEWTAMLWSEEGHGESVSNHA